MPGDDQFYVDIFFFTLAGASTRLLFVGGVAMIPVDNIKFFLPEFIFHIL